jgi:predicted ATPase
MPKQPLDWITVRGYKSISAIERLELRPINILIGPNGSGKSNFIGVFDFLRAMPANRLQEAVAVAGGAEKILHFGSKTTREIVVSWSFDQGAEEYSLVLTPTVDDTLYAIDEIPQDGGGGHSQAERLGDLPYDESRIQDRRLVRALKTTRRANELIQRWRVYHLHDTSASAPIRKTSALHENRHLKADCSNLPAFLYLLREKYPEEYRTIVGTIRQVTPFFDDFVLEPLELQPDSIKLEWRHTRSDRYFDASSLSDGTLRFMALATLFLQPLKYRPSIMLVDEPELGLHPAAIAILAALIQHASTETQVIVSTQSSLLVDYFEPEDVLVADRKDGGTQLRRLDSKDLEAWLEDYSLGQLWEKGELGGRPGSE